MAEPASAEKTAEARAGARTHEAPYRAVTRGREGDEWAVVDGRGAVVFLGDARAAAMIASRLTLPSS